MRFFIALEIPDESKDQLKQIQDKLKEIIPLVRVTDNNKLHLTIAFIGEQPPELKIRLAEVMTKAVANIPPFEITPAFIDGFPNLHQAKIFWVGIKGDIDKLFIIRERIKDLLSDLLSESDERRYIPHIALAKVKNFNLKKVQEEKLESLLVNQNLAPIKVDSIKLFESIPNHGLHKHNTLAEVSLG